MFWRKKYQFQGPTYYVFPAIQTVRPGDTTLLQTRTQRLGQIYRTLSKLLDSNIQILLCGEPGTGKSALARYVHIYSRQREYPLLWVDCRELSINRLTEQLHRTCSRNGLKAKNGAFSRTWRGTVVLEHVDALSQEAQAWMLSVLQQKKFCVPGSPISYGFQGRFIATSGHDLSQAVMHGWYNRSLYYRLSTYAFFLPPLRERLADLPYLVAHFARIAVIENGLKAAVFSQEAIAALHQYDWPNNLHELKWVVLQTLRQNGEKSIVQQISWLPPYRRVPESKTAAESDAALEPGQGIVERVVDRPSLAS